jgi:hypothetical protein
MKKFLLLSLLILTASIAYSYQPPDSCLKYYDGTWADSSVINPDSLMVDSCEDSQTYLEWYSRGMFDVGFVYNIIPRSVLYPKDTIIEYTWNDILSIYGATKAGFQQLEAKYGTFYFREEQPHEPDTNQYIPRYLFVRFENYVNVDSASNDIKSIPLVKTLDFRGHLHFVTHAPNTETVTDAPFSVYPNPVTGQIAIRAEKPIREALFLYDISGKLLKKYTNIANDSNIDISDLEKGVYILQIGSAVQKIIVND